LRCLYSFSIFFQNIFKFYTCKSDENGYINFNKFLEIASKAKQGDFHFDAKKFCANIFPDIDTNKDGMIDFEEFFKLSQLLPGIWRHGEEKDDFNSIDKNKDGKISLKGKKF